MLNPKPAPKEKFLYLGDPKPALKLTSSIIWIYGEPIYFLVILVSLPSVFADIDKSILKFDLKDNSVLVQTPLGDFFPSVVIVWKIDI